MKDFSKETEEKESKLKTANTIQIQVKKKKWKTREKADKLSIKQEKLIQKIFNTYNKSSKKFKNLHKIIFEKNTLLIAYHEKSKI